MEQEVVNEIYWPPDMDSAFTFGSHVIVDAYDRVSFHNRLMTPGVVMKAWSVAVNYQGSKIVPQLPHLKINHQYRIVLHAKMQPENSLMIRLSFNDIQGNTLKQYNFNRSNAYFTVPAETITMSLELVNAGNTHLDFERIEICERNVSPNAHADLWFQEPINYDQHQLLNLLVVPANKRAKKTYPLLKNLSPILPLQVLLVDYQYRGNLERDITKYLQEHKRKNIRLVSCHERFDIPILNLQKDFDSIQTLVTTKHQQRLNMIDSYAYELSKTNSWSNENLVEPNWPVIIDAIRKISGGD